MSKDGTTKPSKRRIVGPKGDGSAAALKAVTAAIRAYWDAERKSKDDRKDGLDRLKAVKEEVEGATNSADGCKSVDAPQALRVLVTALNEQTAIKAELADENRENAKAVRKSAAALETAVGESDQIQMDLE